MRLLEVDGLSKTFVHRSRFGTNVSRVPAVTDVSFQIEERQTLGLIGESGAGKSTTGRLIARLIEPDRGRVWFDGTDLLALSTEEMRRHRAHVQMIFQDPYDSLDPQITVGDSVGEPLLVHRRMSRRERDEHVAALLPRVGLSTRYMRRYPRELSGGQLQRAAIARALSTTPRLIICDEPVTALDILVRAQVINLLMDIQQEFGVAYLFITHDLSLLRVIAQNVCVMRSGAVVEAAAVEALFDQPGHPYSRTLLEAIPNIRAHSRRR